MARIRSSAEDRSSRLRSDLEGLLGDAAPGPFRLSFDDDWTRTWDIPAPPDLVRRGVEGGGPVFYPLFHDRGWFLTGPPENTVEEIQGLILRCIAGIPLKHLQIDVFDPGIEGRLGVYSPLRSASSRTFPPVATSPSDFQAALESAALTAAQNAESIGTEGLRTFGELWRLRGRPVGDYRLIVVLNYPEGVDRQIQAALVRLARNGGANGVSLIVQHDAAARPSDDGVDFAQLASLLRTSSISRTGELQLSEHPAAGPIRSDGAPSVTLIREVIAAAGARAAADQGPVVLLSELISADVVQPWTGDATLGLDALIARSGDSPVGISLRSANPPTSNLLVGGAVGQGKSNLLLDLIYSLAARYSPDDLELYLLDFKSGLEFQRFAPDAGGTNWLPHAKVLSLESDRSFGLAVLRHVAAELDRRARVFKEAGGDVTGIEAFRRAGFRMPRLLLIIDEFQVIFGGDDDVMEESVDLLERLARQGRASGIHLVLSSQTTTGVSGLRTRGEAIFGQFPLRISLKNTPSESEAILGSGNKAAANLTYRGEIVLNRDSGLDPDVRNERAVSAYAENGFLSELQSNLWRRGSPASPPMVFVSTEFAEWPGDRSIEVQSEGAIGFIGLPVAVTRDPVRLRVLDDVSQAIAIVGSSAELALPVLVSLTRSLAISGRFRRVVVIDLSAADPGGFHPSIVETVDVLSRRGIEVTAVGAAGGSSTLAREVNRLRSGIGDRTLVVGIEWQRWRDLDSVIEPQSELEFGSESLRDLLHQLAREGGLSGVHLLGWWSTPRAVSDQFGPFQEGVRHFVTARVSSDDFEMIAPRGTRRPEGHPRVVHIDRADDVAPEICVPFAMKGVG